MSERINVLDIEIDALSAKQAMRDSMEFMASDPVSVIELVTADGLIQMRDVDGLKKSVCGFDLVLAGDRTVLEAAEITERRLLQETENRTFLKLFLQYLHKNHKSVYLLVESEEEGEQFYSYLERCCRGVQIVGLAKVAAENRADDMLVNAINGGEVDCILAALSVPLQEEFIIKNRNLLNVRVWLGIGKDMLPPGGGFGQGRLARFVVKHIFKKEIERNKRIQQACAVK